MIILLFVYALISIAIGLMFFFRKKKLVGGMFILLAILLSIVGVVAIHLYPHIWPF